MALALGAGLVFGCSAQSRYRVLRVFFDGVPEPRAAAPAIAEVETAAASPGGERIGRVVHEPYANKECDACHDRAAGNSLVAINGQLCFQCHDLDMGKRYVHGPLASGGCLGCHDPHSSPYRHLLLSESDGFCLSCHQRADLRAVEGHGGDRVDCTSCHEAHMSDRRYLLR